MARHGQRCCNVWSRCDLVDEREFTLVMSQLQKEMERSKHRLDELCESVLKRADSKINTHEAFVVGATAKLNTLNADLETYQLSVTKVKHDVETEKAVEKRLEEERENLRRQAAEMPSRLAELHAKEAAARNKVSAVSDDAQERARATNQVNNDLTFGIIAFKKRLGLDFQRLGANRLKLNFTQVDPDNHGRVFSFSIHVDEADRYNIIDCTPQVAGTAQLLAALNSSNDFSEFVRGMRCKFRSLCA